jgi:hypothetical protein
MLRAGPKGVQGTILTRLLKRICYWRSSKVADKVTGVFPPITICGSAKRLCPKPDRAKIVAAKPLNRTLTVVQQWFHPLGEQIYANGVPQPQPEIGQKQIAALLSDGGHDTSIPVPAQHWVFTIPGLSVFHISPTFQKSFMAGNACQFASDRSVDVFHHVEVRWKEDVKVTLMHIRSCDLDIPPLIASLYYRRIDAGDRVG